MPPPRRAVMHSLRGETLEGMRSAFRHAVPTKFNIGRACTDDLPRGDPAIIQVRDSGEVEVTTFGMLAEATTRFANVLRGMGLVRGDRVGIVLAPGADNMVCHLGAQKAGMVALPLAGLFGPDALTYRLGDSAARAVVTCPEFLDKVVEATSTLEDVAVFVTGNAAVVAPVRSFAQDLQGASSRPTGVDTESDDPATLVYTSGTTGQPKGALHAHRFLFGHLPGYELYYDFFPHGDDVSWTPADWAWLGALMDTVIPSLYYGRPVVTAERRGFDPQFAADLMAEHRVTAAFIPPTALRMMRGAGISRTNLALRTIFTGGEALGEETLTWALDHLGAAINEGYGQTEANLLVGNSSKVFAVRPGSMGKSMPGHTVAVIDGEGNRLIGQVGELAALAPDPVFLLRYWGKPEATEEKYRGDWLLTGDLGIEDQDGYLWFQSRKDDVIMSMGYRIGPGEIEESLLGHPAVAHAAAIGIPDDLRGEVVKAFIVLADGHSPSDHLVEELQQHVRTRLAAHEVPRQIEFRDELPMTTTGKVMRRALR